MDVFAQDAALPGAGGGGGGGGGGFSLECKQRKVQSKLEEFFPGEDVEADDVNLQWLSMFVEECLSSAATNYSASDPSITDSINYSVTATTATPSASTSSPSTFTTAVSLLPPTPSDHHHRPPLPLKTTTTTTPESSLNKHHPATTPRRLVRTRKRRADLDDYYVYLNNDTYKDNTTLFGDDGGGDDGDDDSGGASRDPQMLQQAYWLADSELLVRPQSHHQHSRKHQPRGGRSTKTDSSSSATSSSSPHPHAPSNTTTAKPKGPLPPLLLPAPPLSGFQFNEHLEDGNCNLALPAQQPIKRCTHCQAHKTPQWREGPMGPKTLCNACGVRYRSGRLLPEYRPARSPTFERCKHSNSHRKVLEIRMMSMPLSPSSRSRRG